VSDLRCRPLSSRSRFADPLVEKIRELLDEHGTAPLPLIDAKGAARFLGVDRETIYALVKSDRLPAIRLGDGPKPRLRFDPQALIEHLIQADHDG
jgi:excisionase family DNA binding protein